MNQLIVLKILAIDYSSKFIRVTDLPLCFLDLNPVENLRAVMARKFCMGLERMERGSKAGEAILLWMRSEIRCSESME